MTEKSIELAKQIGVARGAHIFYNSNKLEAYVENAVSFIVYGIKHGDHVLLLENPRVYPMILKELKKSLSEKEMAGVHFINNFDFYWRNGNFHPPTILSHFKEAADSFANEDVSFRTWGHIEWGNQQDIVNEIDLYEQNVGMVIEEKNAISVCAYDASRVSEDLKERLIRCHNYLMTDDSITCLATN